MSATLTTRTRFIALFHCNDFLFASKHRGQFLLGKDELIRSPTIFQNFVGKCVKNEVEPRYAKGAVKLYRYIEESFYRNSRYDDMTFK